MKKEAEIYVVTNKATNTGICLQCLERGQIKAFLLP